jgi:hypothetical protein
MWQLFESRNQLVAWPVKRLLNYGEKKLVNVEATPQAIELIAQSHINMDGPRAPTAIHGLLGLKFHT